MKYKILVVDDDAGILALLTDYLEEADYTVITANNAHSAWDMLTKSLHNFAVVITDRMMPDMDGTDLTRKIKSQTAFKDLPVIMLTSAAEKEEMIAAHRGGIFDFLMKPIEKKLLLLVVKRALSSRLSP